MYNRHHNPYNFYLHPVGITHSFALLFIFCSLCNFYIIYGSDLTTTCIKFLCRFENISRPAVMQQYIGTIIYYSNWVSSWKRKYPGCNLIIHKKYPAWSKHNKYYWRFCIGNVEKQ